MRLGRTPLAAERTRRRLVLTTATLLALASLLAACTKSQGQGVASLGSKTGTTVQPGGAGNSGPAPSPALGAAQLKYSQCMRSHGVHAFPDPYADGGYPNNYMREINSNSTTYKDATKSCQSLSQAAGMAPWTAAQMEAHQKLMLKIARCMRAHGITGFPDPDASGGFSLPTGAKSTIDFSSPQYARAAKACNGPPGQPREYGPPPRKQSSS